MVPGAQDSQLSDLIQLLPLVPSPPFSGHPSGDAIAATSRPCKRVTLESLDGRVGIGNHYEVNPNGFPKRRLAVVLCQQAQCLPGVQRLYASFGLPPVTAISSGGHISMDRMPKTVVNIAILAIESVQKRVGGEGKYLRFTACRYGRFRVQWFHIHGKRATLPSNGQGLMWRA